LEKNNCNRLKKGFEAEFIEQDDEILKETRKEFDIPLITVGIDFNWK